MSDNPEERGATRRSFLKGIGAGALAGAFAGAGGDRHRVHRHPSDALPGIGSNSQRGQPSPSAYTLTTKRVAAEPTRLPPPVGRRPPRRIEVSLDVREVVAEIEPGVAFAYMTFGGQVPGPMVRVRQGDTVHFTLNNPPPNQNVHNIDFHAVYGTGGGSGATTVVPGKSASIQFKALYPGAFIYHCAVPALDFHISSGMYGMILVEPEEGLPPVERELYLGQHEVYLKGGPDEHGLRSFDFEAMRSETPTYVLLNGEKDALTPARWGAIKVKQGERVRVFFVCGGPNLASHFHPIGNVWSKAWIAGALANPPSRFIQTAIVAPGSCGVFELETPVPETIKLVDHALSRAVWQGMLGMIEVEGEARPDIFNPKPAS
ncbi:MAG TPA: copper-containing nitrite reductase [Gemmatimonadales bacterium]|nr:copper-containing nitrite reductase [Gemmatimonadales bacterium]